MCVVVINFYVEMSCISLFTGKRIDHLNECASVLMQILSVPRKQFHPQNSLCYCGNWFSKIAIVRWYFEQKIMARMCCVSNKNVTLTRSTAGSCWEQQTTAKFSFCAEVWYVQAISRLFLIPISIESNLKILTKFVKNRRAHHHSPYIYTTLTHLCLMCSMTVLISSLQ